MLGNLIRICNKYYELFNKKRICIYFCLLPNNESRQINVMENIRRLYNDVNFRTIDINIFWAYTSFDKNIDLKKYISKEMTERKQVKQYPNKIYCALSHAKIWEDFLNNKYDFSIIMEDDVSVCDNFINNIIEILNEISYFDICFLYHHPHFERQNVNSNNYNFVYEGYGMYGNQCYMLSRNGVKKILRSLPFKDNKDIYIKQLIEESILKCYISKKDLVKNKGAIGSEDNNAELGSTIFHL